ncbi:DedA family protein [Vibrio sinus]|uniref:DedA family protein n=1 Tax=Vibrio sinus TaxID=2946865 RepID=UPI003D6E4EA9
MDEVLSVVSALWNQDVIALKAVNLSLLYLCIGGLIFFESALLPAAPLPCDSVIVLSGSLAAVGILNVYLLISILVLAGWLGSIIAFYQGSRLKEVKIVSRWLNSVDKEHWKTVDELMLKYGVFATFIARFIPVIRALLPMIVGGRSVTSAGRFILVSPISAFFWVLLLVLSGYSISLLPHPISKVLSQLLMVIPIFTLIITVVGVVIWRLKKRIRGDS